MLVCGFFLFKLPGKKCVFRYKVFACSSIVFFFYNYKFTQFCYVISYHSLIRGCFECRSCLFPALINLCYMRWKVQTHILHIQIFYLKKSNKVKSFSSLLTMAVRITGHSYSRCHKLQYTYIYRGDTANRCGLLFYSTFLRCIIAPIEAIRIRIKISYIFAFRWICDWYVRTSYHCYLTEILSPRLKVIYLLPRCTNN